VLLGLLLALYFPVSKYRSRLGNRQLPIPSEKNRNWVESTLKHMSLEEKIGQMLQVRVYGDYPGDGSPGYRLVGEQIRKYHIGSVDLGSRMVGPNLMKGQSLQVAMMLNDLQRKSSLPLLVGADIERGLASRLADMPDFPFPMAFGAIDDANIVEQFARIAGREGRAVGINWAFAPVADVNSNPSNPIINVRSFGENPLRVAALVAAYVRGAHESGLLVTAKHFPGHGDSAKDSHLGIVTIDSDRQHLEKYELPPFRAAIEAGTDSILLAHAAVPAIDPDGHRIATTSPKIASDFLRHELGFQGVILTDALEMNGLMSLYPNDPNPSGRAAVDAIKAGVDVLMLPTDLDGAFNAILSAVQSKEISEDRINQSVTRILNMKASIGLDKSRLVDLNHLKVIFGHDEANEFAQRIADESITLVRNYGGVLPLVAQKQSAAADSQAARNVKQNELIVVSFVDSYNSRLGHEFDRQMQMRDPSVKIFHHYNDHQNSDALPSVVLPLLKTAKKVVIAAFVTHTPGRQVLSNGKLTTPVGLSGDSAALFGEFVAAVPRKTVIVALGSPYLIENYRDIESYICTYSLTSTAERSAVKALFGEIKNHAKLPITLPGVAPLGFSLPWPAQRAHLPMAQHQ
jgi:beta-N-acetylhexosaminidase